jgi:hypothetical protein
MAWYKVLFGADCVQRIEKRDRVQGAIGEVALRVTSSCLIISFSFQGLPLGSASKLHQSFYVLGKRLDMALKVPIGTFIGLRIMPCKGSLKLRANYSRVAGAKQ